MDEVKKEVPPTVVYHKIPPTVPTVPTVVYDKSIYVHNDAKHDTACEQECELDCCENPECNNERGEECQCNRNEKTYCGDSRDPEYIELQNKYLKNPQQESEYHKRSNRIEQARANVGVLTALAYSTDALQPVIRDAIIKNVKVMDEIENL